MKPFARSAVRSTIALAWAAAALLVLAQKPKDTANISRKVFVFEPATGNQLALSGAKLIADYGAFQLYSTPAAPFSSANVQGFQDADTVFLNTGPINTADPTFRARSSRTLGKFSGKQLHLVQFVGPIKPEWWNELTKTGVEVVTYIPNNAYLVYGDDAALNRVRIPKVGSPLFAFTQWNGTYEDSFKIDPRALLIDALGRLREIGTILFAVQLVADKVENPVTLRLIEQLELGPVLRSAAKLNYYNIIAPLPASRLGEIAARPDVISIQPFFLPQKSCERQDQIVSGSLFGNAPILNAGYLAWLMEQGFSQNQFTTSGFSVDVTDSPIDNGTVSPNHFGLYVGGARPGTSRVVYDRLLGTPNPFSKVQAVDGHGNINAHIIGGFNNLSGFPHQDPNGYHYGLGVAPFVRLGSSIIFDPHKFTFPDFEDLQSNAYADGARISSNSWGTYFSAGVYDMDAQSYDALVRDAQPAGAAVSVAGNQEMVIVFANGNDGSGSSTVDTPATAKNVISVGATENVQAFGGADNSGITDTQADSADDVVSFSSRGPCADGRHKPDIVAPGTHVSGGVWQIASPGVNGTADPAFDASGVSGGLYDVQMTSATFFSLTASNFSPLPVAQVIPHRAFRAERRSCANISSIEISPRRARP
jgi:hypothetical protein